MEIEKERWRVCGDREMVTYVSQSSTPALSPARA